MNVLSLFDGISCGRVALERAGIPVTNYYASEIDKYAIQVSQKNYPDIIRLGDINEWENWQIEWSSIDLILAGSPCQGFSIAGKQLAFDDKRSALFFRFAEILSHVQSVNHSVKFLLENVCMKKEYQNVITSVVGVEPVLINSSLVSALHRERLYWGNINITIPKDCSIFLKDIIQPESEIDKIFYFTEKSYKNVRKIEDRAKIKGLGYKSGIVEDIDFPTSKFKCLDANYHKGCDGKRSMFRVGNVCRMATPIECERLQTLLQYEKKVEIVLCLDQAKNFVNVVKKNHKLQQLVLNVENEELKEYVKLVSQSMNVSQASTKPTAHQNVDTLTSKQIKKCTKLKLTELDITANTAEYTKKYQQAEREGNSADYPAFINITEGRITQIGLGVSHQKGKSFMQQMNGKIALELSGKEMVQNAKDVLSVLEMLQTNQHSTSITSFRLSTKNIEQILIICYWFAKNAIDGFIQDTTNPKILYLNLIDGYTAGISNTQRYKCLGNGWTVDVIAHILKSNQGNNYDKNST